MIGLIVPNANLTPNPNAQSQGAAPPDAAFQGLLLEMLMAGRLPAAGEAPAPPLQTADGQQTRPATQIQALGLTALMAEPEAMLPEPAALPQEEPVQLSHPAGMESLALHLTAAVEPVPAPVPLQERAPALPTPLTETPDAADPALEAFVQRAVQRLTAEHPQVQSPAPGAQSEAPARFEDLVRLVAGQERPLSQALSPAQPQNPNESLQPQTQTPVQNQSRIEPQPQTQAEAAAHQAIAGSAAQPLRSQPAAAGLAQPISTEPAAPVETAEAARAPFTLTDTRFASPQAAEPTEAQAPAPAAPVQPEQVIRQVARFLKVTLDGKRSEVRFLLHPEHLGSVAVRLLLQEGVVRANLLAQNQAVKAALETNMEQLRSRLAEQGLRVEQIHVTISGEGASGQPHHSHQREQRQTGRQSGQAARSQQPQADGETPQAPRTAALTWMHGSVGRRIDSLA